MVSTIRIALYEIDPVDGYKSIVDVYESADKFVAEKLYDWALGRRLDEIGVEVIDDRGESTALHLSVGTPPRCKHPRLLVSFADSPPIEQSRPLADALHTARLMVESRHESRT